MVKLEWGFTWERGEYRCGGSQSRVEDVFDLGKALKLDSNRVVET